MYIYNDQVLLIINIFHKGSYKSERGKKGGKHRTTDIPILVYIGCNLQGQPYKTKAEIPMTSCESISQHNITNTKSYMIPQTNITMTNKVTLQWLLWFDKTTPMRYTCYMMLGGISGNPCLICYCHFSRTKISKYYHIPLQFHWITITRITQCWCPKMHMYQAHCIEYNRIL